MKFTRIRQCKCNRERDMMELIGSCCFATSRWMPEDPSASQSLPLGSNPWTETKIIINAAAITKSLTYRNFFIVLSQPNLPANGTIECSRRTEDRHLQAYSFKVGRQTPGLEPSWCQGHFLFLLRPMMSDQKPPHTITGNNEPSHDYDASLLRRASLPYRHDNTASLHVIWRKICTTNIFIWAADCQWACVGRYHLCNPYIVILNCICCISFSFYHFSTTLQRMDLSIAFQRT